MGEQPNPLTGEPEPPVTVTLKFCPTCGRTDQLGALRGRHWMRGVECHGRPVTIEYTIARPFLPSEGRQQRPEELSDA